jgi:hypothetical protein
MHLSRAAPPGRPNPVQIVGRRRNRRMFSRTALI